MRPYGGVDSRLRGNDDIGWVTDIFSSLLVCPDVCGWRLRYSGVYSIAELRNQRSTPAFVRR